MYIHVLRIYIHVHVLVHMHVHYIVVKARAVCAVDYEGQCKDAKYCTRRS